MNLVDTLKALADESRLRIVKILSHGYFNVQEMTSVLELGQSTISHHLKVLQSAGVVTAHREGTWMYYTLLKNESELKLLSPILGCLDNGSTSPDFKKLLTQDSRSLDKIISRRRDHSYDFFQSHAKSWSELRNFISDDSFLMDQIVSKIPQNGDVLDIGCGSGVFLQIIAAREGKTIGVDYSPAMLDEARTNLGKLAFKVDLRLGAMEHLPIGDSSVDITVAYMVMHHIAQPKEALREVFRVLKSGGRLIVVDLTRHDKEIMRERLADLWLGFEMKEFEGWVKEVGFNSSTNKILGEHQEVFILECNKQ